jgi:hypothetical protein
VEPIGDQDWAAVTSLLSQFASLDSEGAVILCLSSTNNEYDDHDNNICNNLQFYVDNKLFSICNIGTVILWSTSTNINQNDDFQLSFENESNDKKKQDNTDVSKNYSGDIGRSPGGKIILTQTKIIRRNEISRPILSKNDIDINNTDFFSDFKKSSSISVLSRIPNDVSTLLLSGNHGKVSKIVRFGEPTLPKDFNRPENKKINIACSSSMKRYVLFFLSLLPLLLLSILLLLILLL